MTTTEAAANPATRSTSPIAIISMIAGLIAIPAGLAILDDYGVGPFLRGGTAVGLGLGPIAQIL